MPAGRALADRIGAEREIVAGRGHAIPAVGGAYNSRVHEFLKRAEVSARERDGDD